MRPQLDGDSRNPPRFSRTAPPAPFDRGFTYQPGRGAGTTGFDSSNRRGPKAQLERRVALAPSVAAEESASDRPGLRPAQSAAQKRNPKENPNQQPHAATFANVAYPVGPLDDPPVLPVRRRISPDEDIFAPTGLHAGTFMLRPAVETTVGYDSNPARSATG